MHDSVNTLHYAPLHAPSLIDQKRNHEEKQAQVYSLVELFKAISFMHNQNVCTS